MKKLTLLLFSIFFLISTYVFADTNSSYCKSALEFEDTYNKTLRIIN